MRCSFVSQLPEMAGELYSGGTHMRRYGWNKHTLEILPNLSYTSSIWSSTVIPDGWTVLKVTEDERSEKSHFSLAVKIKRQSSQSAQLSASFLTNYSVCIEKFKFSSIVMPKSFTTFSGLIIQPSSITGESTLQLKNISWNFSGFACIKLMENHHIAFAASASRHDFTIWKFDVQKRKCCHPHNLWGVLV